MLKITIEIDEMQMKQIISNWWAESIGRVPLDKIEDVGPEDIKLLFGTENCKVTVEKTE